MSLTSQLILHPCDLIPGLQLKLKLITEIPNPILHALREQTETGSQNEITGSHCQHSDSGMSTNCIISLTGCGGNCCLHPMARHR